MIIIASKPGLLGNMIIMHASFLAFGWKNNVKIINPAFHRYNRYFEGSRQNSGGAIPYHFSYAAARFLDRLRIHNALLSSRCIDWEQNVDLDLAAEKQNMKAGITLVQGWKFRANKALAENREKILQYFTPTLKYRTQIDEFVKTHFRSGVLNIGIHIRRGDYKRFEEGQYYYELAEYLQIMQHIAGIFSDRTIRFMITSNENVDPGFFRQNNLDVIFAPRHELLDMYLLTRCDLIAGPPSTYTMWASYYGQVPLCMIRKPGEKISPGDFKVQTYF